METVLSNLKNLILSWKNFSNRFIKINIYQFQKLIILLLNKKNFQYINYIIRKILIFKLKLFMDNKNQN